MAIPNVSGSNQDGRGSAGTISVSLPTGSGFLAVVSARRSTSGIAVTPPSGWSLVESNTGNSDNRSATYVSNGTTPGTSWTAGSNTLSAHVLVIGFDSEVTVDVSRVDQSGSGLQCSSVTTTEGTKVCRIATSNSWPSSPTPTFGYPGGTSNQVQGFSPPDTSPGDGGSHCGFSTEEQASAGATGDVSYSMTEGDSFAEVTYTIALVGSGAVAERDIDAAIVVPMSTVSAGLTVPVDIDAALTVPMPTISAEISLNRDIEAELTTPMPTVSGQLGIVAGIEGQLTAPSPQLSAQIGTVAGISAELVAPSPTLSAELIGAGGIVAALVAPSPTVTATLGLDSIPIDITVEVGPTRVGSVEIGQTRAGSVQVGSTRQNRGP